MTNFDYRKESLTVDGLLPENLQTEIMTSVFNNGINRLLTSPDTVRSTGTIGQNYKNVIQNRIKEDINHKDYIHRTTYQLQPLVYSKIANEEYITSYKDILTKLQFLCGDDIVDRQDKWGECEQFEFAPPIDLDKFVNYQNYVWVDNSEADYIVMNNSLTRANSMVSELTKSGASSTVLQPYLDSVTQLTKTINDILHKTTWSNNIIDHKYQWIEANKWIHKSDAPAGFKAAERPIIEYFSNIEVNEWTYTKHNWLYRKNINAPWVSSTNGPTENELINRYSITTLDAATSSVTVEGDVTATFVPDFTFTIKDSTNNTNDGYYTVVSSVLSSSGTVITVSESLTTTTKHNISQSYSYIPNTNDTIADENLGTLGDFYGVIIPLSATSQGDDWLGLHQHWAWLSSELQTAVNHQPKNDTQYEKVFVVGNESYDSQAYDAEFGFDGKTRYTFEVPYIYDTDDLQVYINGIRQYGTYDEVIDDVYSKFDDDPLEFTRYEYPNVPVQVSSYSIDFNIQLNQNDTILIKVGPATIKDINKHGIVVGCYDETNSAVPKLKYKNLVEYRLHEQVKIKNNQYINFDLYHPNQETAYDANPLFKYHEDVTSDVDAVLKARTNIIPSADPNKPYDINAAFENLLVDDISLLCYKQYENSFENLYSVWRKCPDNYVPKKVDIYRQAVTNNTTPCDWELPAPFIHNIYNECRVDVLYKELKNHFSGILAKQTVPEDFKNVIYSAKLLENYVYTGGVIKIFNSRYDLLVSSIHQNIVNFITLINYAKQQYFDNIDNLKTSILKDILNGNYDANYHIANFLENTYLNKTFSDSTTVKTVNGIEYGLKNWMPSLPILGFMEPTEPGYLYDSKLDINKILHHDGHYSEITSNALFDAIVEQYKLDNPGYITVDIEALVDKVTKNIIDTVLVVEKKLYDRAKLEKVKFQFDDIINGEQSLFDTKLNVLFSEYVKSLTDMVVTSDYTINDAFTWNYSSINSEPSLTIAQNPSLWGSHWKEIYKNQYNTSYPHLEPWKLQGYTEKPAQWDVVYKSSGSWSVTMWDNIKNGIIDSTLIAPTVTPPTYTVISVNDTGTKYGSYDANDLLPPYISIPALSQNSLIVGDMTSVEAVNIISAVTNNYIKQQYIESVNYSYDKFLVLFKLQPLKMLKLTFGDEYYDTNKVGGLLISKSSNFVPSHKDILFHGTLINDSAFRSHGINQWYTNILRAENNIISMDDFLTMWTQWESKLSYQTNSIINDKTLLLDNDIFDIYNQDYSVHLKKSPSVISKWLHSLHFSVYQTGAYGYKNGNKIPTDGNDWIFSTDILVTGDQELPYYGTRNYKIKSIDVENNTFSLDMTEALYGSTLTEEQLLDNNKQLLWVNNETVFLDYNSQSFNNSYNYNIIKYDTNTFGLTKYNSTTYTTEVINLYDTIDCYYIPDAIQLGDLRIDEKNTLYQYTVDGWSVLSEASNDLVVPAYTTIEIYNNGSRLSVGYDIIGTTVSINKLITLNNLTIIIDSSVSINSYHIPVIFSNGDLKYNEFNKIMQYREMAGVWVSYSSTSNDFILPSDSSDIYIYVNSQLLTYGYTVTGSKLSLDNSIVLKDLQIKIAIPSNTTIQERLNDFTVLDKSNNSDTWYNLVLDKQNVKKLIIKNDKFYGIQSVIDFVQGYYTYMVDQGFILTDEINPKNDVEYPTRIRGWRLEIEKFIHQLYSGSDASVISLNPFRYEFWLNTPVGVVSDLIRGPYRDVNLYPIVYDRFGKSIRNMENLKLFRTDNNAHFTYPETTNNFVGGIHIFLDYYEHVIMFNDYTINFNMVYDHFVGINNENIKISLHKHYETTGRPNIGGGFLSNHGIVDNLETDANNFQQLYDTYADAESNEYINNVRALLGYDNSKDFGGFGAKSKFLFWKGLMHQKGSSDSVNMFATQGYSTNINIDEYWAYRISEYGDAKIKREQYVNIKPADIINHNIMYQFVTDGYVQDNKYKQIDKSDITRWNDTSLNNNGIINEDISGVTRIIVNSYKPASIAPPLTNISDTTTYPYLLLVDFFDDCEIFVENEYNEYFNYPIKTCILTVPQYKSISSVTIANKLVSYLKLTNTTIEVPIVGNYKDVVVTYSDGTVESTVSVPYVVVVEIPFHIPDIGMITVYANNVEVEYTAIDNTHISVHLSDITSFTKLAISVLFIRGKLKKDLHYSVLKSNLIKFNISDEVFSNLAICDVNSLNHYKKMAAAIIDTENDIVLAEVPYYHPSMKIYPTKISLVDTVSNTDPANYGDFKWSSPELGQKWLNVTHLGYYNYHDKHIYPKLEDRIAFWGLTSEWSRIQCYEWISSPIMPGDWDASQIGKPMAVLYKQVKNTIFDFWEDEYVEQTTYQIINAFDHVITDGVLEFNVSLIIGINDNYKIYVNEIFTTDYTINLANSNITTIKINNISEKDTIRLVRFADDITTDNIESKSNEFVKYRFDYHYNAITTYDKIGNTSVTTYYFWATNQISRAYNNLSTEDIEHLFIYNNNPYHFYQGFDKWIIKNVSDYVNYNNIALQLIRNDTISSDQSVVDNVNNVYKEWTLINEKSYQKVPFMLWVKIIESMIGKTISDFSTLPHFNKVVYDNVNNTNTRYGINDGQIVGDSQNVITSLFDLLYSGSFDITPTVTSTTIVNTLSSRINSIISDKANFLYYYKFNNNANYNIKYNFYDDRDIINGFAYISPELLLNIVTKLTNITSKDGFLEKYKFNDMYNIIEGMLLLYLTCSPETVNTIFFHIFKDMIAYNTKLDGIFKTSLISANYQITLNKTS